MILFKCRRQNRVAEGQAGNEDSWDTPIQSAGVSLCQGCISFSTFVLVFVWVYVHTFPCVWAGTCMWVCMHVNFQGWGESLSWWLFCLTQWDRVYQQKSSLISVVSLLFCWSLVSTCNLDYRQATMSIWYLCGFQESNLLASCLYSKHFIDKTVFLAPRLQSSIVKFVSV